MATIIPSPFHRGEQKIQTKLGVRDRMERFGQKVIRDHMPEQHQAFYEHLDYLLLGHVDSEGWPWASILFGEQGFIRSPDKQHLTIAAHPITGDPLTESLRNNTKLGLLGIELQTRRRNRMAAHISAVNRHGFELKVDQAFGNCPKYIQAREHSPQSTASDTPVEKQVFQKLDTQALALIANADTFFVSSFITGSGDDISEGVDVSHRGGAPGFVKVDSTAKLTIPDYSGNFHFNTLGNFIENPKAGLLFIDFERGHLLMLSGKVAVLLDSPETKNFTGAERLWTFELDHGIWLKNALPLQWQLLEYSSFLPNQKGSNHA